MWQFSRMVITGKISMDDSRRVVSMPWDLFADLLRSSIAPVFDEKWYLERNPDVRRAIKSGTVQTALDHYIEHGFYENRMPYAIKVDEKYYIEKYEDVKTAVENATFPGAQEHFEENGFREGRLPTEGWRLLDGPAALDFRTAVIEAGRDGEDVTRRRKLGHERV